MNQPPPNRPPVPSPQAVASELQIRNWLRLRRELAELQARLEYLKLLLKLGVAR